MLQGWLCIDRTKHGVVTAGKAMQIGSIFIPVRPAGGKAWSVNTIGPHVIDEASEQWVNFGAADGFKILVDARGTVCSKNGEFKFVGIFNAGRTPLFDNRTISR